MTNDPASPAPDPEVPHPEMSRVAGSESSPPHTPGSEADGAPAPGAGYVPNTALIEVYRNQLEQNQEAHRKMRWWAFSIIGLLSGIYLLFLLSVLWHFFDGRLLAAVAGAQGGASFNWHLLVLIGLVLVIFAAIPLSLAMALVKMISDKESDDEAKLKMPSTELGKILVDVLKAMIASAKS